MSVTPLSPDRDWRPWLLFWLGVCAVLSGCQRAGQQALSGTVTFAGQPLDDGIIQFFEAGENPRLVAGAKILKGRYEVPSEHGLPFGQYLVRISSTESTELPSGGGPAMSSFRVHERLPAKYNTESTLSVDVQAGGRGQFDFNLE